MNQIIRFIVPILLFLSLTAQAAEKLECVTNEFAPFGFMDEGRLTGIEVDLLQDIAQRLNLEINLTVMPWKRILHSMKYGTVDCMFAAFNTSEREAYMDYTTVPLHISSLVFFEKKGSNIKFESLDDLNGLTIGLVHGFKTTKAFDAKVSKGDFSVEEVNDFEQNFKKLSSGRIDLVLVNSHVGGHILKKHGITNVQPLPVAVTAKPSYLTFSKKRQHADLIPLFDAAIKKSVADGSYQKIFDKYIQN